MNRSLTALGLLSLVAVGCRAGAQDGATSWSWQQPHATVLETGDLQWQPEPFKFRAGATVRYIDYEAGNDANPGTREQPWQHHPSDPAATSAAKRTRGVCTYVFKRGVVYRGTLTITESGTADEPLRLTSDPGWGTGVAVLCGSEQVTGWQRGADNPSIPEPEQVWYADLGFSPRNLWMVSAKGEITRVPLARTPNWTVSDPDDIKSEWWEWDMPGKPFDAVTQTPQGKKLFQCTDTKHLIQPADYYENALVWTEYGWVMGTPYPTRVELVDAEHHALGIGGQWGGVGDKRIIRHNRYYLEDKPHYLDSPGEFWFDRRQNGTGRLYLRLPGDQDPNTVQVEAAQRLVLVDLRNVQQVEISGLTFRFTNVAWDLTAGPWAGQEIEPACVQALGSGHDLTIANCRFEQVTRAVRMQSFKDGEELDGLVVRDNEVSYADHAAFDLADAGEWGVAEPLGRLYDVKVLRNKLEQIGLRPSRFGQGHAIQVRCAQTLEVAGNVLDQCYGSGIFVYGGKQSGAVVDRPFSRILIHHNKVTNSLLNTNDWGGIETWQGGPAYVYDNLSGNPGGYWNYNFRLNPKKPAVARFGHAYYLDGAFKNYYFNNIAWGKSSDPLSRLGNTAAFQEIHGYQNTFFNNTAYCFVTGSRRQAPVAGRNAYLGNVWQDIGFMLFRHADPKAQPKDGNAADAGRQGAQFALDTNAYADNVFFKIADAGVVEPSGRVWQTVDEYARALASHRAEASSVGAVVEQAPLRDAPNHDFRLQPGSAAVDAGVQVFVPWALSGVVGEWHFRRAAEPSRVLDEHWYLTPYFVTRDDYYQRPTYPLQAVGATAESYTTGPLEDWTAGALQFDGRSRYCVLKQQDLAQPFKYQAQHRANDWLEVAAPAKLTIGQPATISVRLLGEPNAKFLHCDLHYTKQDGAYGGTNAWGGDAQKLTGEGPYTFRITPQPKPELGGFSLTVFLSQTGQWADHTDIARVPLGLAQPGETVQTKTIKAGGGLLKGEVTVAGEDLKNPDVHHTGLLIEAVFRAAPGSAGVLVEKLAGRGYSLVLNDQGQAQFRIAGAEQRAQISSTTALNDGKWHHVLAEVDATRAVLALYADGRLEARSKGPGSGFSLSNQSDLYVGGTPDGRCLNGALEFVRIALGTLAEAHTSIAELYTWEFDGPFKRDFAGHAPAGRRDAGALELSH